jgi:predicted signal transduction protein with EAL and GGDEF domain
LSLAKTASIGFATFPFAASEPRAITWSQVVELADRGLYMAKSGGRNTWVGIAANGRTDPKLLAERLATSAEEIVDLGEVEVFRKGLDDGE